MKHECPHRHPQKPAINDRRVSDTPHSRSLPSMCNLSDSLLPFNDTLLIV